MNIEVSWKFSLQNLGAWCPLVRHKQAVREVFSAKIVFLTNSQKFSPSKVSHYMVDRRTDWYMLMLWAPEMRYMMQTWGSLSSFSLLKILYTSGWNPALKILTEFLKSSVSQHDSRDHRSRNLTESSHSHKQNTYTCDSALSQSHKRVDTGSQQLFSHKVIVIGVRHVYYPLDSCLSYASVFFMHKEKIHLYSVS